MGSQLGNAVLIARRECVEAMPMRGATIILSERGSLGGLVAALTGFRARPGFNELLVFAA